METPIIHFGKHKDVSAAEMLQSNPGYLTWIVKSYNEPPEEEGLKLFWTSQKMKKLVNWIEKQDIQETPKDIFLPMKANGEKYTIKEVCKILSDEDIDYDEIGFFDKYGDPWEAWKIKSLLNKLSSHGYLE